MDKWQKDLTDTIGAEVKRLREKESRSTMWLQDETERLGFRVSRSSISQLEAGNRTSISLAEVLVLAAALDIPPALLIFPYYPDGETHYLPGKIDSAFNAVEWVAGQRTLESDDIGVFPEPRVMLATERDDLLSDALRKIKTDPGNPMGHVKAMNARAKEIATELKKLTPYVGTSEDEQ
ncbi:helix-turn-helix domain-containing protein [Corynebacterium pseudopelargi]|uniref:HTH cro/C1-type domain-containing protein n=1 Tax=Corynebacterium pseudopelargi TaxID=2080757 RepID=A0A3G6ISB8_9CORY|nr:helix-turn-helix transcriptional regulator [Corynebacterium pseudopelargi]AZA08509.1 hypothetical protein CPPEL_01815 [Corynebacterium pseudopelargi]